jgi:pimeloyl-ACP methyl ester carboxylesterase
MGFLMIIRKWALRDKMPGAGHWLHADRPRESEATIAAFFTA